MSAEINNIQYIIKVARWFISAFLILWVQHLTYIYIYTIRVMKALSSLHVQKIVRLPWFYKCGILYLERAYTFATKIHDKEANSVLGRYVSTSKPVAT